jgi:hypothetical protein
MGCLLPFPSPTTEPESRVKAALYSLPEVPLLIAGLQYAAILHHDTKPARKVKRAQKPLHGCGKNLRRAHLAAKLHEISFLIVVFVNIHTISESLVREL